MRCALSSVYFSGSLYTKSEKVEPTNHKSLSHFIFSLRFLLFLILTNIVSVSHNLLFRLIF